MMKEEKLETKLEGMIRDVQTRLERIEKKTVRLR